MNRIAVALCICLPAVMAVSCGEQDEREREDGAYGGEQDELQRAAAALEDMNDYMSNSYDYTGVWLDYTTENGETDYRALYAVVSAEYGRVVRDHGFESADQWLAAVDRYMEEDMIASAREGYMTQADDILRDLKEHSEHGYHEETPEQLRSMIAASDEISDYMKSGDIDMVMLDHTSEGGEIDHQAVYEAVSGRYLEIVQRHGFQSVEEWKATLRYYLDRNYDEMIEFDYGVLHLLDSLEHNCRTELDEEQP